MTAHVVCPHCQAVTRFWNRSKITQDVRDFAAKLGVSDEEALKKGMEVKAVEFVKKGAEIYSRQ